MVLDPLPLNTLTPFGLLKNSGSSSLLEVYLLFFFFKKAFDSVNRVVSAQGVPEKLIIIIIIMFLDKWLWN